MEFLTGTVLVLAGLVLIAVIVSTGLSFHRLWRERQVHDAAMRGMDVQRDAQDRLPSEYSSVDTAELVLRLTT